MKVLDDEREICESCGHMVFSRDRAFTCPCQKCLEAQFAFKPRRRLWARQHQPLRILPA